MDDTKNKKALVMTCLVDYFEDMEKKYQDMGEKITQLEHEREAQQSIVEQMTIEIQRLNTVILGYKDHEQSIIRDGLEAIKDSNYTNELP